MIRIIAQRILFALLVITAFISCDKEEMAELPQKENPKVPTKPYAYDRYVSPCLQWEANETAVRTYMKSLEGWKEIVNSAIVGGTHLNFSNQDDTSAMNYEFKFDCLTTCIVTYYGPVDTFELLRTTVGDVFQVNTWKSHTHVGYVTWFTSSNPLLLCNLEIGKSEKEGYMYVRYAYSAYDWK